MITQEQLDELKEEERYHLAMAESCCESNERGRISHTKTADALAAAIATIEAMPVTRDGVRVIPGVDKVYQVGEHIFADGRAEPCVLECMAPGWNNPYGVRANAESERDRRAALAAKGGGDA